MKKLALTSLLAVFAVSGAHAANVIDGNPLYMPKAGHAYSVTALESHTEPGRTWVLGEEFGYGISDKLAVIAGADFTERSVEKTFDTYAWDSFKLGAAFRALDMGAWKADLIGQYKANSLYLNRPAGDK